MSLIESIYKISYYSGFSRGNTNNKMSEVTDAKQDHQNVQTLLRCFEFDI